MMKLKVTLILLLLMCSTSLATAFGQFAISGGYVATPIIHQEVQMLSENIEIHLDRSGKNATYELKYTFKVDSDNVRIPFLFVQEDAADGSLQAPEVYLDGQVVEVEEMANNDFPFSNFLMSGENGEYLQLDYGPFDSSHSWIGSYAKNDLVYVEQTLTQGTHHLRLKYSQERWENKKSKVSEYSFHLSRSSAAKWQQQGEVQVEVIDDDANSGFTSNLLNSKDKGTNPLQVTLKSSELPFIVITKTPELSLVQKAIVALWPTSPIAFILIFCLLFWAEWKWVERYRKKGATKKFSAPAIVGGILLPILSFLCYVAIVLLTEHLAGSEVNIGGGFMALMIFIALYAGWLILLLSVLFFTWLDRNFKKKYQSYK